MPARVKKPGACCCLPRSHARCHWIPSATLAVTRTQNFLSVQQEEPYGDLVLTRGPFL